MGAGRLGLIAQFPAPLKAPVAEAGSPRDGPSWLLARFPAPLRGRGEPRDQPQRTRTQQRRRHISKSSTCASPSR
ncbi:hypothetical protein QF035_004985 [Streptomyces umbrinus]|uniref:Uncharacterized protein n=1 Tax=Streptomyces umbrinus TaxID=67370 RepID=A0ABU0SV25_9ACTN|nr:hypothetical protein [Streptomyces umbrinus]